MSDPGAAPTALETYLAGVDAEAAPVVRALDSVIRGVHAQFDVAIRYKILTYALHGDWRYWVCAIDVQKKSVALHFHYGVMLDDPRGVLRAGSSVLTTWDLARGEAVDAAAVGAYVAEAVARYPVYKANNASILDAARVTAAAAGRRKPRG